jgi:hypothetical protein
MKPEVLYTEPILCQINRQYPYMVTYMGYVANK